jgi:hypothetical protein
MQERSKAWVQGVRIAWLLERDSRQMVYCEVSGRCSVFVLVILEKL